MTGLTLAFAILMCLVNAVLWTAYTEMPIASLGWVAAAIACFWLQKWSKR